MATIMGINQYKALINHYIINPMVQHQNYLFNKFLQKNKASIIISTPTLLK